MDPRFFAPRPLVRRLAAACAVLLGLAGAVPAPAQSGAEARGRVLDAEGAPIQGATVRATALPGGASRTSVTDAAGAFAVTLPPGGERYELHAERVGFYGLTVDATPGPGELRVERELRLSPRAVTLDAVQVRSAPPTNRPPAAQTPGGQDEASLAAFRADLPLRPGDLAALAALQRGVLPAGADGGFSIAGQGPEQNDVSVDGASFGASTLPAEALRSTAVVTSTFDPARGQFSGGQLAATTLSGTNLFGGAARLRVGHPALQAGGRSAGLPGEQRVLQLDGGAGGALVRDRFYVYGALQATERSAPLVTLQNAGDAALRGLGVSPDSARRLAGLVDALGYAPVAGRLPRTARSTTAQGLLRLDYVLGEHHVAMLRLDGRTARVQGAGESPFALAGSGSELRDDGGGVLAQLTSYLAGSRNELRLYVSGAERGASPYRRGPAADVRVEGGDGGDAESALLRFGGSPLSGPATRQGLVELSDELVLPLGGERGRAKVGFLASRETASRQGSPNPYGTFGFGSLEELAAGRPATFTRLLGSEDGRASVDYAALFAGHLWRPHRNLSLIYGVRAEGRRYAGAAPGTPLVAGLRPGTVSDEWGVSPRLGFTWDAPSRRWAVRGGAGEFRGRVPLGSLAAALAQTGGAAPAQLVCVGPAAPVPDWRRYAADPASAPSACAGGETVFAARTPRVTLFSPSFAAPRTWQGTLAASRDLTLPGIGMLGVSVEARWVEGRAQTTAYDRNLSAAPAFVLADEGGRPVYAPPSAIDPATGGISPTAGRAEPALGPVRLVESRGRSRTAQLSAGMSLLTSRLDLLFASYTLTDVRDQVGALAAPGVFSEPLAGRDPRALSTAASDLDRRHLLQLRWIRPIHPWPLEIGVVGRLVSGAPFTPRVQGDVNGDGSANDAAFVPDPGQLRDAALAAGMERLLDEAPGSAAACLRRQRGRVAGRNSCRGPWAGELDVQASLWPGQEYETRRFTVSITATNLLAGADRLVHGPGGLRGWGQGAAPDPTLLYVRGFDAEARAFRYGVNPGFGAPRPGTGSREPFTVVVQGRWTFGKDPVRQPLLSVFSAVRVQGRSADALRTELARTIPNLPAQVLAVADTLGLELAPAQRERLRAQADSVGARLAPVVDSLAAALSTAETSTDDAAAVAARARVEALSQEAQSLLDASLESVRQVLDPEQWRRLPAAIQQPSQQILPAREGIRLGTGETW